MIEVTRSMDKVKLENDLRTLAEKKTSLSVLDYHLPEYDTLEEELHELEDALQLEFGDFLEGVISEVHDKYCPDADMLIPIGYMASKYIITEEGMDVEFHQGVPFEVEDNPDQKSSIVLVPAPTRILLLVDENKKEEVWKLE